MRIFRWLAPALILLILFGILVPISPLYRPVPSDDPSVYLYIGQRILEGSTPYRDAWDHKQPLAFFLFAFGQVLTPHSLWGMWWIELVLLGAAAFLALRLMRSLVPRWVALLSVAAGLLTLAILIWGYSLEELSLPLQILCLLALTRFLQSNRERERIGLAAGVGVVTGICFFLKQSLVGAGAAVGLYLALRMLFRREWGLLRALIAAAAGFAVVAALVLAYLFMSGAWPAYREAAVGFNLAYANLGPLERVNAILSALVYTTSVPGLFLGFCLWLVCAAVSFLQAGPDLARWVGARLVPPALLVGGAGLILLSLGGELVGKDPGLGIVQILLIVIGLGLLAGALFLRSAYRRARLAGWLAFTPVLPESANDLRLPFFHLAALLFPITLVLLSLSGRNYVYYFIALVPALILLVGLAASLLFPPTASIPASRLASATLLGLGIALAYHPALLSFGGFRAPRSPAPPEIVRYIQAHTRPEDTILVWGKDTTFVYFSADRKGPSRQFYQAAVSLDAYNDRYGMSSELYRDLQAHSPALFVIQGEAAQPGTCPLAVSDQPNTVGQVFAFICQNYRYTDQAGEFQIYQKRR